jgi:hypothetical protein
MQTSKRIDSHGREASGSAAKVNAAGGGNVPGRLLGRTPAFAPGNFVSRFARFGDEGARRRLFGRRQLRFWAGSRRDAHGDACIGGIIGAVLTFPLRQGTFPQPGVSLVERAPQAFDFVLRKSKRRAVPGQRFHSRYRKKQEPSPKKVAKPNAAS